MTGLYYEAHITVEAGLDCYWTDFTNLFPGTFKCSKFDEDQVDDYNGKWFMSARDTDLDSIILTIRMAVERLEHLGFSVLRWKIEDTVLDSKYGDTFKEKPEQLYYFWGETND